MSGFILQPNFQGSRLLLEVETRLVVNSSILTNLISQLPLKGASPAF